LLTLKPAKKESPMRHLYPASIFIGSFLLFLIQPMLAKTLLPSVGGAPAVWIVTMLFFQLLLLAGYGYAAITSAYITPKRQLMLHLGLLALAILLVIPIQLTELFAFDATQPEKWVLATLLATIGLPYFLLSSNATLIQRWYHARTGQSPYFLFAISNLGSFLGLLGYPFAVEWLLPLAGQKLFWSIGFVVLFGGLAVMLLDQLRHAPTTSSESKGLGKALPLRRALMIVLLGFIPSSLFLSTTLYITTDVASFPLLWVIPLGLYLLSFVIVFASKPERAIKRAQNLHLFAVMLLLVAAEMPLMNELFMFGMIIVMFGLFFVIAISAHGRAAQLKPEPNGLTAFYFWLSLGGALGGLFNTAAPYLFHNIYEFPIVLLLSLLALPASQFQIRPIALGRLILPPRLLLAFAGCLLIGIVGYLHLVLLQSSNTLLTKRSFFGVSTVMKDDEDTKIIYRHGSTVHGYQPLDAEKKLVVTSYYFPLRNLLDAMPETFFEAPFAVGGLGAGTLGCYGRAGQDFTFYEIDPLVVEIASNPAYFTYLRDCAPNISTRVGDARLLVAQEPDAQFNLLIMDAFTSDAVPMHLLTLEAMQLYASKLTAEGMLAYNISNRILTLEGVLAAQAEQLGMIAYVKYYEQDPDYPYDESSIWFLALPQDSPWHETVLAQGFKPSEAAEGAPLWRDDYSNILSVIRKPF
jgi:hypothetical protein